MTDSKPTPGQFAVVKTTYRWILFRVEYATEKQMKGTEDGYTLLRTVPLNQCMYFGDEAPARLLRDRLVSSDAQHDDENRKANERRSKRNAELISAAKGDAS